MCLPGRMRECLLRFHLIGCDTLTESEAIPALRLFRKKAPCPFSANADVVELIFRYYGITLCWNSAFFFADRYSAIPIADFVFIAESVLCVRMIIHQVQAPTRIA